MTSFSGCGTLPGPPVSPNCTSIPPVAGAGILVTVESLLGPILPLFARERAAGHAVAIGVLVHTAGSTYRKPGALMLIAANGDFAGLLSGGCLEADLREHARSVIDTGQPRLIQYDMRGGDDLIWGLGLGCEGAMHILLLRVGAVEHWQPLEYLTACLAAHHPTAVGIVIESEHPDLPVGAIELPRRYHTNIGNTRVPESWTVGMPEAAVTALLSAAAQTGRAACLEGSSPPWKLFALPLCLPPKLLLLGAGPDAAPVVDFAARLNWKITLVDHRPVYANPDHFPLAERVLLARPEELLKAVDAEHFSAAVVMSHHLPSDLEYLRALAATAIPYIGLLGPAVRRERLMADLGATAQRLIPRLHAPVGLALGGRTPESIALSIIAQIHAVVHGAAARGRGAEGNVQSDPAQTPAFESIPRAPDERPTATA
jgi:xanthine dehydrogenase accessory factor